MSDQSHDLADYLSALKRRRSSILWTVGIVFLIGALVAGLLPATYQSTATILIKEQDIPPELIQSTVTSYAAQRIQAISQRVMARSKLSEIIDKYNLYAADRERLTSEEIIEEMRDNISMDMIDADVVDPRTGRPTAATIAFQVSFTGEQPNQVQNVTNELMSLYLKENLRERSEKATETFAFLDQEAERLSNNIRKLEKELAAFKEKHGRSLPELADLNRQIMDRTEREMSDIDAQIRALEERRILLQGQLAQLKPFGASVDLDPATRLQALRTQYFGLLARYSADHPDVIRAKREMRGLEEELGVVDSSSAQLKRIEELRGELATLRKKYSDQHPDVVKLTRQIESLETSASAPATNTKKLAAAAGQNPDNPAYIQAQSQLDAAGAELRALRAKKENLRAKLVDYEQRLMETPQVEAEYRALARQFDSETAKYQEISAKKMSAKIAQELEKDSKGERFEIVEPPILPEEPVSPNRPAILFLSLILALGAGIGFAAVAESLDESVHGSKSVASILGAAPLAMVPYLETERESSRRKRRVVTRAAVAVGAVVLVVVALHMFWTPLDVLWYKALRKADVVINT
jgi:succinoglycan biosynthesis transport protein ExoP